MVHALQPGVASAGRHPVDVELPGWVLSLLNVYRLLLVFFVGAPMRSVGPTTPGCSWPPPSCIRVRARVCLVDRAASDELGADGLEGQLESIQREVIAGRSSRRGTTRLRRRSCRGRRSGAQIPVKKLGID
jgi:hypothetical protein